jgi:hypothetical protein
MKYLIPILGALLILVVSCQPTATPGTPVVTKTVIGNGDTLQLSWPAVTSAQGYYVNLDGTKNTVSGTSYFVIDPVKSIKVTAYNGSEESDPWSLTTSVVVTPSVVVYTLSDPTHNDNAFGFNTTSGACLALDVTNSSNYPDFDFLLEDRGLTDIEFWSPHLYDNPPPPYNTKENSTAASSAATFDNLVKAAAIGQQLYDTKFPIAQNGIYSVWIDPDPSSFGASDRFGKISIEAISGTQVTLKAGYQLIGALRWLMTP